jgi:hypothetical protein
VELGQVSGRGMRERRRRRIWRADRFADCRSSRGTGSSVWPPYARATKEANLAGCLPECNEYLSASRRAIAS